MLFRDRVDAGQQLAARLQHLAGRDVVVLGLPRGGVPVAAEVAHALGVPLDIIVVRKLGAPFQPEFALGALGEEGVRVMNPEAVGYAAATPGELSATEEREQHEIDRRALRYRGGRQRRALDGRVAVIVDDGIATGSTARAACQVARALGAEHVVLAVPVAPEGWEARIGDDADEKFSVATPPWFFAIGQFYEDFAQTSDAEVAACLDRSATDLLRAHRQLRREVIDHLASVVLDAVDERRLAPPQHG